MAGLNIASVTQNAEAGFAPTVAVYDDARVDLYSI